MTEKMSEPFGNRHEKQVFFGLRDCGRLFLGIQFIGNELLMKDITLILITMVGLDLY